jgi:hypothetical protein
MENKQMSKKPPSPDEPRPEAQDEGSPATKSPGDEPGSNEVEHQPDPNAQPIPDGHHKYTPRSPYTAGND